MGTLIHHKTLQREMTVPDAQVATWLSTRSPWELGPLKPRRSRTSPTANRKKSPKGDTQPPPEEDDS